MKWAAIVCDRKAEECKNVEGRVGRREFKREGVKGRSRHMMGTNKNE